MIPKQSIYTVYLSDGTKIDIVNNTVYDKNGNWIKYNISTYSYRDYDRSDRSYTDVNNRRVSSIVDSVGRTFNFSYSTYGDLQKVEQKLSDGSLKTIVTFSEIDINASTFY